MGGRPARALSRGSSEVLAEQPPAEYLVGICGSCLSPPGKYLARKSSKPKIRLQLAQTSCPIYTKHQTLHVDSRFPPFVASQCDRLRVVQLGRREGRRRWNVARAPRRACACALEPRSRLAGICRPETLVSAPHPHEAGTPASGPMSHSLRCSSSCPTAGVPVLLLKLAARRSRKSA